MIGAAKRILPNSFRKASAHGILEDVPHGILDCVPGSQDVVVVALLPQAADLELPSSDILNALLRQFYASTQLRLVSQALHNQVDVIWHHAVRKNDKHLDRTGFLNLINRRMRQRARLEDTPPASGDEAQ